MSDTARAIGGERAEGASTGAQVLRSPAQLTAQWLAQVLRTGPVEGFEVRGGDGSG